MIRIDRSPTQEDARSLIINEGFVFLTSFEFSSDRKRRLDDGSPVPGFGIGGEVFSADTNHVADIGCADGFIYLLTERELQKRISADGSLDASFGDGGEILSKGVDRKV